MNQNYINYTLIGLLIISIIIYINYIVCKNNKAIKNVENMIT